MRLVDRALQVVGLTRLKRLEGGIKAYAGASASRLFHDWVAGIMSADAAIQWNLSTMRARARQLCRDNPYAAGFVRELSNNVVGPEGIQLLARIMDASDEPDREVNWAIQDGWTEWSYPENASVDGHDAWQDIERLAIESVARDGEALIRHRPGFDNDFGYSVQLLDPDLLDETFDRAPGDGVAEIRMGVEINADGRPLAYHLFENHPNDRWQKRPERLRVPASEVIHLFVRQRPGQTRGVTWFAPALTSLKMLDGYEEAELVAARLSAAAMGFITNDSEAAIAAWSGADPPDDDDKTFVAEPGTFPELKPGQSMDMFAPTHPTTAYKDFVSTVLRAISRGLGVSYVTLTGDLTSVNYSSIRAGLLSERDNWRALQRWFSTNLHRRVYREWIGLALLAGGVTLPLGRPRAGRLYYRVHWKARGWKWVDPENDLKAAEMEIALGLNSRRRLAGEQGRDWEEVVDEIREEEEYASEQGVDIRGVVTRKAESQDGRSGDKPAAVAAKTNGNGNGTNPRNRLQPARR